MSPCPLCGAGEVALRHRRPVRGLSWDIARCGACGLLFLDPFPARADLLRQYDANYFRCPTPLTGGYEDYLRDERWVRRSFERRMPFFLPPTPGRVLDVGCATGVFLDAMRDHGWTTSGLEVSSFAADVARSRGHRVEETELERAPWPRETFDLISLWDVVEHLADPVGALGAARALLAPTGRLVLSTPDAGAPIARLLGRRWLGFRSLGEHVTFFDRRTIRLLLERAGFHVTAVRAAGKYLPIGRLMTRLGYYTRFARRLGRTGGAWAGPALYLNSGDTMMVLARPL